MSGNDLENLPFMLYADGNGNVYDHPHLRMAGFSGLGPMSIVEQNLAAVPDFSKLFFFPGCPPVGIDPSTGEYRVVTECKPGAGKGRCFGVAVFLEAGLVRTHLPAVDYGPKDYTLPMWAYCAAGFREGRYLATAFRVEYNPKWDPRNYDDRKLVRAIRSYRKTSRGTPLEEHLLGCATENHCFAAKNLFLRRWEAPLPVSRRCNARCLGCLSLQAQGSCKASHHRIAFRPSQDEIVSMAVGHLARAPEAIVSFGQGCEGEPLTEHRLIAGSIRAIRKKTDQGTINLNTNGSLPDRVSLIAQSGLDSIRISMSSARPDLYRAYYRPRDYDFEDVVRSISLARERGLYTMVNYLVFPGVSDQEEEIAALISLVRRTGLNFLHLKNLCIDPQLYLEKMPKGESRPLGMKTMADILKAECPGLELGYFNKAIR